MYIVRLIEILILILILFIDIDCLVASSHGGAEVGRDRRGSDAHARSVSVSLSHSVGFLSLPTLSLSLFPSAFLLLLLYHDLRPSSLTSLPGRAQTDIVNQ